MVAQAELIDHGFRHTAKLHWEAGGEQFRLEGARDVWRETRCFIYVWFDESRQRALNVGHTGQAFSARFGDYVRWLNGKRKNDCDTPIRKEWLSCLVGCQSGRVEVWIRASTNDRSARESDERRWITQLRPILNRR